MSQHAEQDHFGSIPQVLERFHEAKVMVPVKAKPMLMDLLHIPENKFVVVADGATLSLGDKILKFIHTPRAHWFETMSAYLIEDKILFSCVFLGLHIASTDLFVTNNCRVHGPENGTLLRL